MQQPQYKSLIRNSVQEQDQQGDQRANGLAPPQKTAWDKLTETWALELSGFLVGLASLAAAVALLREYDNQPIPEWSFLTINVVLSVIGNVAFTCTMFGIHSTVAQLKWIWFAKKPRPLADLAGFQKAGGPIGIILLFFFTTGAQLIVIALSVAMAFGMLWSPFIQNLVSYETRTVTIDNGIALVGRSVQYDSHGLRMSFPDHFPDPLLAVNMMVSLSSGSSKDVNSPQFFCSTGNCTWPPVATLGFCSRCTDITSRINVTCTEYDMETGALGGSPFKSTSCSAILPNGTAGLAITGNTASFEHLMNITQVGGYGGLRYHAIRLLQTPLLNGAYRPPISKSDFAATECLLSPCVLSFTSSVRNGVYDEKLLDTFTEPPPPDNATWLSHQLRPPWGPERGIDPAANLSFGLGPTVIADWSSGDYLTQDPITGFAQTTDGHSGIEFCSTKEPTEGRGYCTPSVMTSYMFNANYTADGCGSVNGDVFSCAMEGIARALTKTVRNAGVLANGTSGAGSSVFLATGQAEAPATFVRVKWYWIALPVGVWLLGFATWAVVATQSGRLRLPTWRESPLPLLFLYREDVRDDNSQAAAAAAEEEERNVDGPASSDGACHEFLGADNYSDWAYTKISADIHVQLRRLPALPGKDDGVANTGTMHLVQST